MFRFKLKKPEFWAPFYRPIVSDLVFFVVSPGFEPELPG